MLFISITLARVAALADVGFRAGWLGWIFSIGLGIGVFTSAYYMRVSAVSKDGTEMKRSRDARIASMVSLAFFVIVDGIFNVIEVLRSLTDQRLLFAAWVYGVFPTVAAGLLGILQGYLDRLPQPPKQQKYNIAGAISAWVVSWVNKKQADIESSLPPEAMSEDERLYQQFKADMMTRNGQGVMKASEVMTTYHLSVVKAHGLLNRYKEDQKSMPPV